MGKHRIYVYAICKNERQFAERWVSSMQEADGIYVLDTGSTDGTPELLRQLGVNVAEERIDPWRFDTARNRSLELVPQDADLCVCTDLDEVFHPGWREQMERALCPGIKRLRYRYTWDFLPDGSEGCVFWIEKAHARQGFRWVNPVHEVLVYDQGTAMSTDAEGVQLDHYADETKSRVQYLPLLELAVQERPDDDRNMHYLGREYYFRGMWAACEKTLLRHLAMPSATWDAERCQSMRYLASAMRAQGRNKEAESWLLRAAAEAPGLREPWLDAAEQAVREKMWSGALYFAERALAIGERGRSYINEAQSWGAKPYDLAALSAYYLGLFQKALEYGREACRISPDDERLRENLAFYEKAV